jgi:hypothetical protein
VLVTREGKRGWCYGHPLTITSGQMGVLPGGWFPAAFIARPAQTWLRGSRGCGGEGVAGVVERDKGHDVETERVTAGPGHLSSFYSRERVSRAVHAFLSFQASFGRPPAPAPQNGVCPPPFSWPHPCWLHGSWLHPNTPVSSMPLPSTRASPVSSVRSRAGEAIART